MIEVKNQDELFKGEDAQALRKQVIDDLKGAENVARKKEAMRRYSFYKDGIRAYVIDVFTREFGKEVAMDVLNRISSLNICKKVVNKKARVYKDAVTRELTEGSAEQKKVFGELITKANVNIFMKKANRYHELQKNVLVRVTPVRDDVTGKWYPKAVSFQPSSYDVIPNPDDPEQAMAIIFSAKPSAKSSQPSSASDPTARKKANAPVETPFRVGDGVKTKVAGPPADDGPTEFIWWTSKYHFTTNEKGEITKYAWPDTEDATNPIGVLPYVNLCGDQDGSFWALGGDDLVEGTLLINVSQTDVNYIAKYQGMGIFYAFGKGIPTTMKIGPNDAFILNYEKDQDPVPEIGFASSNPPLEAHMAMIEKQVSMLLSTNDLEPSSASGRISASQPASGIQEIIQQSEPSGNVEDERAQYIAKEPEIVRLFVRWCQFYAKGGNLAEEWKVFASLPENLTYSMKFQSAQVYSTAREKVEVIQARRDAGLDTLEDSIKMDDPNLTEEQVKAKVERIEEYKAKNKPDIPEPDTSEDDTDVGT